MEVNWQFEFNLPTPAPWFASATMTRNAFATDTATEVSASTYQPLQVHWHSPSEHTVDGKSYAAEAHMVTQSSTGEYAVLGVFFEQQEAGPATAWADNFFTAYTDRFNTDLTTK